MILAPRVKGEGPGRPKCVVNAGQIEFLRELGLKWTQIAALLGITTRTLYNIRLELGLVDRSDNFTDITDQDLDRHSCFRNSTRDAIHWAKACSWSPQIP